MAIPPREIWILFTNYDITTYFLNMVSCSEHFISIKHRILETFNIKKKIQFWQPVCKTNHQIKKGIIRVKITIFYQYQSSSYWCHLQQLFSFICKLDIFPMILLSHIVHINGPALILENIIQHDVTLWPLMLIKIITSFLKVETYIITSIPACLIGLSMILVIMSVSTLKAAVILYIMWLPDLCRRKPKQL